MRTLITGGIKSGKSSYALIVAEKFLKPRYFIATAEAFDDEMKERIKKHKAERLEQFVTIEEPIEIAQHFKNNMVLDCIPLWINNLFYYNKIDKFDYYLDTIIANLPQNCVIVTNETGMGFIPNDPLTRQYGVLLGLANQALARASDTVILSVAGIPLIIKSPA